MREEKQIHQEEIKVTKLRFWTRVKHWWTALTREEWELTVLFPGETKVLPDGIRLESGAPKTYHAKKIIKLTNTHIIFVDLLGIKHEIKLVNPVGYDLKKIY